MGRIVDPMDALVSFEPALQRGELKVQPGTLHPDVVMHMDHPNGELRLTYAKVRNNFVDAIAMIVPAGVEDGIPVFQIGYAVPRHLRKRGLGKQIATAATNEFVQGLANTPLNQIYLEAIVSRDNIASQKIAQAVIGGEPKTGICDESGEPIFVYIQLVKTA